MSEILSHQFQNSSYFNFFQKLEKKHTHSVSSTFGLIPVSSYTSNQFKLTEFNIESYIQDVVLDTNFHLKYINGSSSPVEAKYVLPLPPTSTVYDMRVEYDGKVLVGKIKEKTKAQNQYSDAIASGGQSFMAERNEKGDFVLSLGNVPPGKEVDIKLKIIGELGNHLDTLHYFLHKFFFPAYDFKLNLKLNIRLTGGIEDISLLYGYGAQQPEIVYDTVNGRKLFASFSLALDNFNQNNIVVVIKPVANEKPLSIVEYNEKNKTYCAAINFQPSFDSIDPMDIDQRSEFIFLVDCSGSMSGEPIQKAKSALEICIRGLSESHKFNIYCFGSGFKKLFVESKHYNDHTLQEASKYIKTIDANLGGTELISPIKDILNSQYDQEFPKQVFIFTDGEVDDRDGLINVVSKEAYVRIFTYGIGTSVDRELITGLSKACKGYYEFIDNVKEMEARVMKLFNIAMEPTVSNVKVDWKGLPFTLSPFVIRPIFTGERLSIFGLTETPVDKEFKNTTITLTGTSPTGQELTFQVPLDFENANKDSYPIHSLAAYSIIKDLCEEENRQNNPTLHEQRVIKLGKQYGIVSKHTSYIVTHESKEVTTETMQNVQVNQKDAEPNTTEGASITDLYSTNNNISVPISSYNTLSSLSMDLDECELQGDSIDSYMDKNIAYSEPLELMEECKETLSAQPKSKSSSIFSFFKSSFTSQPPRPVQSSPSISLAPPPVQSSPMPPPYQSISQIPVHSSNSTTGSSYSKQSQSPVLTSPSPRSSPNITPPISTKKSESVATSSTLLSIISSQNANGTFDKNKLPFKINVQIPQQISTLDDVWVAIYVLEKLKNDHINEKDQWNLTAQKALKYIRSILQKEGKFDQLQALQTLASA